MKKDKIRILQINAGSKYFGGVSSFLFQVYKKIDKNKYIFDFLSPEYTTYGLVKKDIEEMGGSVNELNIQGNFFQKKIQLTTRLKKFLENNYYDIVHINSGSVFFNLIVAYTAKKVGIRRVIVHSHNGINKEDKLKNWLTRPLKKLLIKYTDEYLACSWLAARAMFPKKKLKNVKIVKNGIEINKFKFNNNVRRNYINELNLKGKLVIGNVGRFVEQKNHEYLLKVFYELHKMEPNAVLLLIGEGPLQNGIKKMVANLNLKDCVKFLGLRNDVPNIMQAIDIFLLPSKYEGLPIVAVEAQSLGVKCILSDRITDECKFTDALEFLSIDISEREWALEILKLKNKYVDRESAYENTIKYGYTMDKTAKMIDDIYMKEENL